MSIIKSGSVLGLSTLFKILSGLVIIKMMAWILSPEEFGVLGQLMTAVGIVSMFAGGGITNGVIKMLSSSSSESNYTKTISSAAAICIMSCGVIALLLLIFVSKLSNFIFGDGRYFGVFLLLAFSQIIIGLNNLILAIFSSKGESWKFAQINIYGSLVGMIIFALMIYMAGFTGAAYALVLLPATAGIFALFAIRGDGGFRISSIVQNCDKTLIKQLLSYSMVMIVAVSVFPIAQMLSRNYLGSHIGWEQVGYWQGVLKISDVYMQFIGIVLINYALPKFARCDTNESLMAEFKHILIPLLSATLVMLLVIYMVKIFIIQLLFSEKFIPMQDLFMPQLVGDFFRTISSTITFLFLARNKKIVAVASEIFQGCSFFLLTVLLYPLLLKTTPVYAHLITFMALSLVISLYFLYYIDKSNFKYNKL